MCIYYLLGVPRLYTTPLWRIIYLQTHHTLNLCHFKHVVYPVYYSLILSGMTLHYILPYEENVV